MFKSSVVKSISGVVLVLNGFFLSAQTTTTIDGKSYTQYQPKYFKPHRGIFYTLYISPVYTLDPLGLGGKSTYAISVGSRFRIWESYSANDKWSGLKVKGFYTALGYEYYPQQYSKTYVSVWGRVQNFLPLAFKADLIYARGYGLQGLTSRWSIGVEVKNISLFLYGELYKAYSPGFGYHPNTESPYTNAGGFYAIIPIYSRKEK
ncbi:MAG TPA: hypothetical protein DGG95_02030 [Cytophagales bacterium]|nr:hypothetical protein [Cytophagales bacterium]